MCAGDQAIAKTLDKFIINEGIMQLASSIKKWVGIEGDSDHFLVFMEIRGLMRKPPTPFKLNSTWLQYIGFNNLVQ